ncbi:anthrone oxygenase family protein [Curtobacterium sp. ISL-83]|uniref:anthrone oxygenase family protein n=1 Tax=Curtobacterium sp. ISL-83 TaxID=2819145 RepID=UPI001BE9B7B3|nr:DUF1772 domain-containing protein [Curtobacterium sp. ISL-83]MBT2503450.1 DUF1772 domain-containing protein [Curtobacterium sp. ISL-83]
MNVLLVVQLVLVGLLAGEEFIVRWGVQRAISRLPDDVHVRTRIALVKTLKVVVPILIVSAVLASIAVVVADWSPWRIGGMVSLVVFVLASFLGTVPINIGVNDWDPAAPPANWKQTVRKWERIDVLRSTAAGVGFVLFTVALVAQLG